MKRFTRGIGCAVLLAGLTVHSANSGQLMDGSWVDTSLSMSEQLLLHQITTDCQMSQLVELVIQTKGQDPPGGYILTNDKGITSHVTQSQFYAFKVGKCFERTARTVPSLSRLYPP
jgi:hypothetical protein